MFSLFFSILAGVILSVLLTFQMWCMPIFCITPPGLSSGCTGTVSIVFSFSDVIKSVKVAACCEMFIITTPFSIIPCHATEFTVDVMQLRSDGKPPCLSVTWVSENFGSDEICGANDLTMYNSFSDVQLPLL